MTENVYDAGNGRKGVLEAHLKWTYSESQPYHKSLRWLRDECTTTFTKQRMDVYSGENQCVQCNLYDIREREKDNDTIALMDTATPSPALSCL